MDLKTEFMDNESIKAHLIDEGLTPLAEEETSHLMISEKVIRCESGDVMIAAMGSDRKKDDQIHLVIDAVHLCLQSKRKAIRLILGRREKLEEQAEVENAVALMIDNIKIPLKIETEIDCKVRKINFKPFEEGRGDRIEKWMNCLNTDRDLPKFAADLEQAISDDSFKWYKNVTSKNWSGRVGGLEVCKLDRSGSNGELNVGRSGKFEDGKARQEFINVIKRENILKEEIPFSFSNSEIEKVAKIIRELAKSREKGALRGYQREHLLESQILSEKLKIITEGGILQSVCKAHPFQFPTLWEPSARPRFIDALMRLGNIPYVVELKEPQGSSPGQAYRHAFTQAVLYSQFVRKATKVHPWFISKGLDPLQCKAIVAFPALSLEDKNRREMLLAQHKLIGNAFGVETIEIQNFE